MGSINGVEPVAVVRVDMEDDKEGAFDEAVDKACQILGKLDAFVHCYTYEGMYACSIMTEFTVNLRSRQCLNFCLMIWYDNTLSPKKEKE